IKRVIIQNERIAILQSGSACGCSEFMLFDEFGRHIKTVDGYHKGSNGFPWAMDVTYDLSRNRYVLLSRNPGRIVEIDTDGSVLGEKLLPFDGVYMDLYYFVSRNYTPSSLSLNFSLFSCESLCGSQLIA